MDGLRSEVYAHKRKCHVSCSRSQRSYHPRYLCCRAYGTTSRSCSSSNTRRNPAHIPYTTNGNPLSTPPSPPLAHETYATAPATGVVASKTAYPDQSRQSSPLTICVRVLIDERRPQVVCTSCGREYLQQEMEAVFGDVLCSLHTMPLCCQRRRRKSKTSL